MSGERSSSPLKTLAVPWDDGDFPPPRPPRQFLRWLQGLSLVEWVVVAAIVAALILLLPPQGDHDRSHRFPPPRRSPKNAAKCAGDYYQGSGLGRNQYLRILPDGRYSYFWSGCTGIHERESGEARDIGGLIVLSAAESNASRMARVFVPARWGPRTYLIPLEEMSEFCEAITDGAEPRTEFRGRFYLDDPQSRVTGVPSLPQPWASYLDQHLVLGKVVAVVDDFTARLDIGTYQGLQVDDVLVFRDSGQLASRVIVTAVEPRSCLVRGESPVQKETSLTVGRIVVGRRNVK